MRARKRDVRHYDTVANDISAYSMHNSRDQTNPQKLHSDNGKDRKPLGVSLTVGIQARVGLGERGDCA